MSRTVWKIQPLPRPSEAHAADAIEIVGGEAVRRVTLPQLDYDVYLAFEAGQGSDARELAAALGLTVDVTSAALHRLAAAGMVNPSGTPSIQ